MEEDERDVPGRRLSCQEDLRAEAQLWGRESAAEGPGPVSGALSARWVLGGSL